MITERGSAAARSSIAQAIRENAGLYTMDVALAESLNAIWKHHRLHRDIGEAEYRWAAKRLGETFLGFNAIGTSEVGVRASDIAAALDVAVYDALYVAAAEMLRATLLTADGSLYKRAKDLVSTRLLGGD